MKCLDDLIELCENNVPISLKSLINTINQESEYETFLFSGSTYYGMCQLELYEEDKNDNQVCAWNFATIYVRIAGSKHDVYDIHISRTDLTIIGTDEERLSCKRKDVDINDTVYIVCIGDNDDNDIANMNIYDYPGGPYWKKIKRIDQRGGTTKCYTMN